MEGAVERIRHSSSQPPGRKSRSPSARGHHPRPLRYNRGRPKAPYISPRTLRSPQDNANRENATFEARRLPAYLTVHRMHHVQQHLPSTTQDLKLDGSGDRHKAKANKSAEVLGTTPSQGTIISDGSSSWDRSSYGGDLTQDDRIFEDAYPSEFHTTSLSIKSLRPAKPKIQIDSNAPRYVLRVLNPKNPGAVVNSTPFPRPVSGILGKPTTDVDLSSASAKASDLPEADCWDTAHGATQALERIGKHIPAGTNAIQGSLRKLTVTTSTPASAPNGNTPEPPAHADGLSEIASQGSVGVQPSLPLQITTPAKNASEIVVLEKPASSNPTILAPGVSDPRLPLQDKLVTQLSQGACDGPPARRSSAASIASKNSESRAYRDGPVVAVQGPSRQIEQAGDKDTNNLEPDPTPDLGEELSRSSSRLVGSLSKVELDANLGSGSTKNKSTSSLKDIFSRSENLLRRLSSVSATSYRDASHAATGSLRSPRSGDGDDDDLIIKPAKEPSYPEPQSVEGAKLMIQRLTTEFGKSSDHERNLTARPTRKHGDVAHHQTIPSAVDQYLKIQQAQENLSEAISAERNKIAAGHGVNSFDAQSLERVIVEIESVLRDALSIAQSATEKEEKARLPFLSKLEGMDTNKVVTRKASSAENAGETRRHQSNQLQSSEPQSAPPGSEISQPMIRRPPINAEIIDDYHQTLTWLRVLPDSHATAAKVPVIVKEFPLHMQLSLAKDGEARYIDSVASKVDDGNKFGARIRSDQYIEPPAIKDSTYKREITVPQPVLESFINKKHQIEPKPQLYPSATVMRKVVKKNQKPTVQSRVSSANIPITAPSAPRRFEYNIPAIESSEYHNEEDFYIVDFGGYYHSNESEHKGCYAFPAYKNRDDPVLNVLGESTGVALDTLGPTHSSNAPLQPIPERLQSKSKDGEDDSKNLDSIDRHHHSLRGLAGPSLSRVQRRAPIARDWENAKKRLAAGTACMNTALLGFYVGIYAGQVPALQYIVVDENSHYVILGNVVFFLGLAISTAFAWPLPLLYGRKPFIVMSFALILALQFPQAIVVSAQRTTNLTAYRIGLLLPRAVAGFVMGFANVNFFPTLLDVFGASLQSGNPHQEIMNEYDVRRHGGGMGVWVSIWTCCYIGSIGLGFLIGAILIAFLPVVWGFWLTIMLTLCVLLANVLAPEVRRSAYRKSLSEAQDGPNGSRRIGRGEVMMHLYSTGPLNWYDEVRAGTVLSCRMLQQPGFALFVLYQGWIYGQVVMVMILLGALVSTYYMLPPQWVAMCVIAFPIGSFLAIPFQKASVFSRARHHPQRTDSATFGKRVTWSSHLIRRALFMVALPFAGLAYTLSSSGPDTPMPLPVVFSAVIGFLSNLALSECTGIIMETFDVSDLQPGMTGRPRKDISASDRNQRTNFSSFPRILSAIAVVQTCSFIIAAIATAVGGSVERQLGAQTATAVVAGTLLLLTILLVATLTRARTVQIVATNRAPTSLLSGPGENLPVIIGHPSGKTRRISLLEMGALTRWTEIRRKNGLLGGGGGGGSSGGAGVGALSR